MKIEYVGLTREAESVLKPLFESEPGQRLLKDTRFPDDTFTLVVRGSSDPAFRHRDTKMVFFDIQAPNHTSITGGSYQQFTLSDKGEELLNRLSRHARSIADSLAAERKNQASRAALEQTRPS